MALTKITENDLFNKGNINQPDVPNLTTAQMQHKLDELSLDVIVPKFNNLIDELEAAAASGSLGVLDGEDETTIQALFDSLRSTVTTLVGDEHTHANKDELDTITQTLLDNIDSVLLMLTGITAVASSVTDTPSKIPTCRAIVNYVSMLGGGDMMKSTYDSDDDGTVNDSDKLGGELPSYYQKATDTDLLTTDKTTTGAINEVLGDVGDVADDLDDFTDVHDEALGGSTIETIGESSVGTYDVGELFVADDGFVYKATAIIAVGNTLSGSNCSKTNIKAEINATNTAVANSVKKFVGGGYVPVDSLAYDSVNNKLGLKVNGADTVIPFSGGEFVRLGTARSYDLSSRADYQTLTHDNFLCCCLDSTSGTSPSTASTEAAFWTAGATFTPPTWSYNSSTGVLSISGGTSRGICNGAVYIVKDLTLTITTYLIK